MISVTTVTKQFGEVMAVSDVTFTARAGEIIGFLGPNGAGKTTMMRLILGYLTPTVGHVSIDGEDPIRNRIQALKKIGYLAENNPLYQEMKVNEYLQFIAKIKETDNIEDVIKNVDLSEALSLKIENLSRGYKQRVGLAAALIGSPEILILDEPTFGLDPIEQEKIRILIKKLSKNKTIIFSTHMLSEVENVANKLIIIDRGRIVFYGKKPNGKGAVEKLFKKLIK